MSRQGDGSRDVRVSVLADTGVRKELWGLGEAGWGRASGDTTEVQALLHQLLPCCGNSRAHQPTAWFGHFVT